MWTRSSARRHPWPETWTTHAPELRTQILLAEGQERAVLEAIEDLGRRIGFEEAKLMTICRRKGRRYRVGVVALEWAGRPPTGAIWFDAYRARGLPVTPRIFTGRPSPVSCVARWTR